MIGTAKHFSAPFEIQMSEFLNEPHMKNNGSSSAAHPRGRLNAEATSRACVEIAAQRINREKHSHRFRAGKLCTDLQSIETLFEQKN